MRKGIYTLWTVFGLLLLSLVACERDGVDNLGFYPNKTFKAISNLQGQSGYGEVVLTWDLPDSTSSLFYVEILWREKSQIVPKYKDSVCVSGLEPGLYDFRIVSHSVEGETMTDSLTMEVVDRTLQPPLQISAFAGIVEENNLNLSWKNPIASTFSKVVFDLYKGEQLLSSVRVGGGQENYILKNLQYQTPDYRLVYYGMSESERISEKSEYRFSIGNEAPDVPAIQMVTTRINAAHNAEITWEPTDLMDSLSVRFTDMSGAIREFHFAAIGRDGEHGEGYLSLLPGGTIEVEIQACGMDGTWSRVKKQKIKALLKEQTWLPRANNGYTDGKRSKLGELLYQASGRGKYDDYKKGDNYLAEYSFEELAKYKDFTLQFNLESMDEMEFFVNLEILKFTGGYAHSLTPDMLVELIGRLPKLKEVQVAKAFPGMAGFKEACMDIPRIKFKEI